VKTETKQQWQGKEEGREGVKEEGREEKASLLPPLPTQNPWTRKTHHYPTLPSLPPSLPPALPSSSTAFLSLTLLLPPSSPT
jgi:hypothetical protein